MSNNYEDVVKNVFEKVNEIMSIVSILAPSSQLVNFFTKIREACHWLNDDIAVRTLNSQQTASQPPVAAPEEPHGGV